MITDDTTNEIGCKVFSGKEYNRPTDDHGKVTFYVRVKRDIVESRNDESSSISIWD
jgi:hypothetical protein